MEIHKGMIMGRKGDYRNIKAAILEGKAIQADALKISLTPPRNVDEVRASLTARLEREKAERARK